MDCTNHLRPALLTDILDVGSSNSSFNDKTSFFLGLGRRGGIPISCSYRSRAGVESLRDQKDLYTTVRLLVSSHRPQPSPGPTLRVICVLFGVTLVSVAVRMLAPFSRLSLSSFAYLLACSMFPSVDTLMCAFTSLSCERQTPTSRPLKAFVPNQTLTRREGSTRALSVENV